MGRDATRVSYLEPCEVAVVVNGSAFLLWAGALLLGARQGPPSESAELLPDDREKEISVVVTEKTRTYEVVVNAPVDGTMTRDPIGYGAFSQGWQPNRWVKLENIGDTDVVNPWIIVNGKRRWRTLDEIAAAATRACTSDAEKARAIWGTVLLTWDVNPQGSECVAFKVYASDEKGFTPSDTEYDVLMGRGFCRTLEEYEARSDAKEMVRTPLNYAMSTSERQQLVVGPDVAFRNANKAYYRVVAVDAVGLASGPSDYAEAPRPFIYTRPDSRATVGKRWEYRPRSLASIGDLRSKPGYKSAFWGRETQTFSLVRAPKWLTIDPDTGHIAGVPPADAVGAGSVTFRVTDNRGKTAEQTFEIRVTPGPT
jgi:hypothetical protein